MPSGQCPTATLLQTTVRRNQTSFFAARTQETAFSQTWIVDERRWLVFYGVWGRRDWRLCRSRNRSINFPDHVPSKVWGRLTGWERAGLRGSFKTEAFKTKLAPLPGPVPREGIVMKKKSWQLIDAAVVVFFGDGPPESAVGFAVAMIAH